MRTVQFFLFWLWLAVPSRGQTTIAALPDTASAASTKDERSKKPKFIPETDQRFFLFRSPVSSSRVRGNVWGARVGFLLPSNVKLGVGYYFGKQQAGGQWDGLTIRSRRLSYATAYVEPYYFRRKYWEVSTPVEIGYGQTRYQLGGTSESQLQTRRTWAVPLGMGVSFSVKFPAIGRFKPTRWFGVNLLTGYRLMVQEKVPNNPNNFNGFYYSISPAIFLDRFYKDFNAWRNRKS